MDYDNYSYAEYSYDDESYGDDDDDDVSHYGYGEDKSNNDYDEYNHDNNLEENEDEEDVHQNYEAYTSQVDESITRKSDDWYPYDSDDDSESSTHHVIISSTEITYRKRNFNHTQNSSKLSSELDFEYVITVLFNQVMN